MIDDEALDRLESSHEQTLRQEQRPDTLDPSKLHIHGIEIGAKRDDIQSKYRKIGKKNGWTIFASVRIDPDNGFERPFLAAQFDESGRAVVLRGSSIGYRSTIRDLKGWEELKSSGMIPTPAYKLVGTTYPPELFTPDVPELQVGHWKGKPTEFFIGKPSLLGRLRIENSGYIIRGADPAASASRLDLRCQALTEIRLCQAEDSHGFVL
jgi:hypothetical protein